MKHNEEGTCPICHSTWIKKDRMPYVGIGGTNYIACTCKKCGHKWEETD